MCDIIKQKMKMHSEVKHYMFMGQTFYEVSNSCIV